MIRFHWAHFPVDGPFPYVMISDRVRFRPWQMMLERWLGRHWSYTELREPTIVFIEWRRLWIYLDRPGPTVRSET
jgi:hypothetical protein